MDSIPDPDTTIYNLQYDIVLELINIINKNNAWKHIANTFDIIFQQEFNLTPSEKLIEEIGQRMCTVNTLKTVLTHCNLYDALALFKSFEPLLLIEQPSDYIKGTKLIPIHGQLKLACKATGIPLPKYQWIHNKNILKEQTSAELCIDQFTLEKAGEYQCLITQEGSDIVLYTDYIRIECSESPIQIIESPSEHLVLLEGSELHLNVKAIADRPLKYQWFKDFLPLLNEQYNFLKIHCLKLSDTGHYTCNISNSMNQLRTIETRLLISKPSCRKWNPSDKVALLIGNDTYEHMENLRAPRQDVSTISQILTSLDFKVLTLINLTLNETKNAISLLCDLLPVNAYVVFYFAGHGYYFHEYFMLSTDSSHYSHHNALCEKHLIKNLQKCQPRLIFTILDMCLIIPQKEKMIHNDIGHPEEYEFKPAGNLVRAYATANYLNAYERVGQTNGIYVNHLKKYLGKQLSIDKVLNNIAKDMENENQIKSKQIPSYYIDLADVEQISLTDNILSESVSRYSSFVTPPASTNIVFEKNNIVAKVKFRPLDGTILNALEIEVGGIPEKYFLKLDRTFQDLDTAIQKSEENYIIYVYNIQKLKSNYTLSVHLYSNDENHSFIDWSFIDVGLPLVAKASLWHTPQMTLESSALQSP